MCAELIRLVKAICRIDLNRQIIVFMAELRNKLTYLLLKQSLSCFKLQSYLFLYLKKTKLFKKEVSKLRL